MDYVIRAIRILEYLEGTNTLERVGLEAALEKAIKDRTEAANRILEIEQRLRALS